MADAKDKVDVKAILDHIAGGEVTDPKIKEMTPEEIAEELAVHFELFSREEFRGTHGDAKKNLVRTLNNPAQIDQIYARYKKEVEKNNSEKQNITSIPPGQKKPTPVESKPASIPDLPTPPPAPPQKPETSEPKPETSEPKPDPPISDDLPSPSSNIFPDEDQMRKKAQDELDAAYGPESDQPSDGDNPDEQSDETVDPIPADAPVPQLDTESHVDETPKPEIEVIPSVIDDEPDSDIKDESPHEWPERSYTSKLDPPTKNFKLLPDGVDDILDVSRKKFNILSRKKLPKSLKDVAHEKVYCPNCKHHVMAHATKKGSDKGCGENFCGCLNNIRAILYANDIKIKGYEYVPSKKTMAFCKRDHCGHSQANHNKDSYCMVGGCECTAFLDKIETRVDHAKIPCKRCEHGRGNHDSDLMCNISSCNCGTYIPPTNT